MNLGKFTKSPDERKRYVIEYEDWLDAGEQLSDATFTVSPTGALEIDAYLINEDGLSLAFFAAGGNDGETYEVLVQVSTTGGQIKENTVLFVVREL